MIKNSVRTISWIAVGTSMACVTPNEDSAPLDPPTYEAESTGPMRIGTNLTSVTYSTTERPFVDLFKMAGPWLTRSVSGSEWDSGKAASVPKNADGWPLAIPTTVDGTPQIVHTLVPYYEAGTYTIRAKGRGQIVINSGTNLDLQLGGGTTARTFVATFPSGKRYANFLLQVRRSEASDPIREIEILPPGFSAGAPTFHPEFKRSLAGFRVIRFMDWQRTNDAAGNPGKGIAPLRSWSQRTKPTTYTQAGPYGVAYEYQIQLAAEVGADAWINVPHPADDGFLRNLARLARDRMPAGRRIYVEYTNEAWNGIFAAGAWIDQNVAGANRSVRYGARSKHVMDIFTAEFGADATRGSPSQRLVRVLGGQAVNEGILRSALSVAAPSVDAIAIAPYFGQFFTPEAPMPTAAQLAVEPLRDFTSVERGVRAHKALATQFGKTLIAYEGGQHFVGVRGRENDQALTDLLITFNRSAQMRDLYTRYLDLLNREGLTLFVNFSSSVEPSKWGSWGIREYLGQPVGPGEGQARKEWAIREWIRRNP
jgi:hypothetical protein